MHQPLHKISDLFAANQISPLENHPQLIKMLDILSRHEQNDLVIESTACEKLHFAFLHAINAKLGNIYLANETVDSPFKKNAILAFTDITKNDYVQLKKSYPQNRIIAFVAENANFTDTVKLESLSENQLIDLLKFYSHNLENHYDTLIPVETILYAYSLAKHYLGGSSLLDTTLALLDSALARNESDRLITTNLLSQIVSEWTHIPLAHLHHNKFKLSRFTDSLQKQITGQDTAIKLIGTVLQANTIFPSETVLAPFIFIGEAATGKKSLCLALADYLYGTHDAVLEIDYLVEKENPTLSDIMVFNTTKKSQRMPLLQAIREKPYAILLADRIENASDKVKKLLEHLFVYGYGFDKLNQRIVLTHTINIITTTIGTKSIRDATQKKQIVNTSELDLMQLVLNNLQQPADLSSQFTINEIQHSIRSDIKVLFSNQFINHAHIIPFFPLDPLAVEKIVKHHLEKLSYQLANEFSIELHYTQDIIQYIASECLLKNTNAEQLDLLFKDMLHSPIANVILSRIDKKNQAKRLALYLSEAGDTIHCHFLSATEDSLHGI